MEEELKAREVKHTLQGIPVLSPQETVNSLGLPKEDWETYREHDELGDLGKVTAGWWSNNWQGPVSGSPAVEAKGEGASESPGK